METLGPRDGSGAAPPAPEEDVTTRALARQRAHHVASVDGARVCAADGCDTKLSRYNKKEWCALHEP